MTRITPTLALDELRPTIDVLGQEIQVGDHVRSFDFAMTGIMRDGTIGRTETTGEYACYVDGEVEAIGEDVMEGCPRYRIRVVSQTVGGEPRADLPDYVYPPVNGTKSLFGDRCCGVFALDCNGALAA